MVNSVGCDNNSDKIHHSTEVRGDDYPIVNDFASEAQFTGRKGTHLAKPAHALDERIHEGSRRLPPQAANSAAVASPALGGRAGALRER